VIRGHAGEPAYVLVLATLGAPPRRGRLRSRRPQGAAPEPPPESVTTTRATLVGAKPLELPGERWLSSADLETEARTALEMLEAVVHKHRSAAADPRVPVPARERALVVRVGYGAGEQVADGRWSSAVEVPAPRPERRQRAGVLRPQERLAAILGGRDVALACEELALRARLDADAGRWREAAFQLRVALEAAIAELRPWSGQGDIAKRIAELSELRGAVGDAANAALDGGLDDERIDAVRSALERVEAALRARTQTELGQ
jgi:hypothetical protein